MPIVAISNNHLRSQQMCGLQPRDCGMAGSVLDYESEVIYKLTEDLLHQLCGVNTTFSHISCGYGLFPPKSIQAMSPEVTNWGDSSYYGKNCTLIKHMYYIYLLILFPKKTTPILLW